MNKKKEPHPSMNKPQELELAQDHRQALQRIDAELPAERTSFDIERLFQYAIEAKADPTTIERMMAIRREVKSEYAKEAFNKAMTAFQAECPPIDKDQGVPDRSGRTAYKFAPLEHIAIQIKPYCQKHGFSYAFDQDLTCPDGYVGAVCRVTHSEGHSEEKRARYRIGNKTPIMSDTQQDAAAFSFACRYALRSSFGLVLKGEDTDAITGRAKPQGPSSKEPTETNVRDLAKEVWSLLGDVCKGDRDWRRANQYLLDESIISDTEFLPDIPPKRFQEIISKLKERKGAK